MFIPSRTERPGHRPDSPRADSISFNFVVRAMFEIKQ